MDWIRRIMLRHFPCNEQAVFGLCGQLVRALGCNSENAGSRHGCTCSQERIRELSLEVEFIELGRFVGIYMYVL